MGEEKRDQRWNQRNYNSNSVIRFNISFALLGEERVRLLAYFDTKSRKYLTSRAERKFLVLVSDKGSGKKKKKQTTRVKQQTKVHKIYGKKI